MTTPAPVASMLNGLVHPIRAIHFGQKDVMTDPLVCMVCAADLPRRWTRFPSPGFTRLLPTHCGGVISVDYPGDWHACRKCAPLIQAKDWRRLGARVYATVAKEPIYTRDQWVAEITGMCAALEQHLGPGVEATRRRAAPQPGRP